MKLQFLCAAAALSAAAMIAPAAGAARPANGATTKPAATTRPANSPTPAAKDAEVRVVGLEVIKPLGLPTEQGQQALTGRRTGTRLTLQITRPDKCFLNMESKDCELVSYTDDKLMDMLTRSGRELATWRDGPVWVSPDGHGCLVDVFTTRTPSPSAEQLRLSANLVFRCGLEPAVASQVRLVLAKDQKMTAGPVPMKITAVRRENEVTYVTLMAEDTAERIGEIAFFEIGGGKEIECKKGEQNVIDFMGSAVSEQTWTLHTAAPAVGLRVKYYKKIEKITVPVDVKTGVGP